MLARRVSPGAHARLRRGPLGTADDLRRARRAARRLLRPARAPPAHARLGPARPARRLLRARAARASSRLAAAHARRASSSDELAELRERAGTRDRDLDLLVFEIDEIEALAPNEERRRSSSRNASGYGSWTACGRPAEVGRRRSRPEADAAGVARCSAAAERLADTVTGVTRSWTRWRGGSRRCGSRPRTWAGELRRYEVSAWPPSLGGSEHVEERLDALRPARAQARRQRRRGAGALSSAAGARARPARETPRCRSSVAEARARRSSSVRS